MSETAFINLPEKEIREYCAGQPIARLSVFGSAVRNELTPESDIDLLVEYLPDAPVGYFTIMRQARELGEILGRQVDLFTRKGLKDYIRAEVETSARLIYAQEPSQ